MAAGMLASPGTEYGPCENDCDHRDCTATRKMAATVCRICKVQIGYDRRFYSEGDPVQMVRRGLVHAVCLHEEIEGLEAQAEMASVDRDPARAEMLGEEAHAGRKQIAEEEEEGGCDDGL